MLSDLPSGHRIGAYQIRSLLGRGGMGEVYRAHDSHLRRDVAIKILPDGLANDAERLSRFEQEARALAALSHPNIAAIYGVEDRALVLELVEGDTLAERLLRGPLPNAEAVSIARQIAEGLEAAHEASIVHRDLKPANIKITPAGLVKLLDFGIAKVSAADDDETRAATQTGTVIGTAAYMSPEQARGQHVDKRTDIWSYGCVLFELLTGTPAFAKATSTDTLAAILEHDPDWSLVPSSAPPSVVALLRRCLIKDRRDRLRDIGEARIALTRDDSSAPAPPRRRVSSVALAALAAVIVAGVAIAYLLMQGAGLPPAPTMSFPINPPTADAFRIEVARGFFDLAPDRTRIAFEAGVSPRALIWMQDLGDLQPREIAGTEGGGGAEWSPDGKSLAFFADDQLKRVDVQSGVVTTICDVPDAVRQAASWGSAGDIAFGSGDSGAIWVVTAAGGVPEVVVKRAEGQTRVLFPMFLPDGRRFLYVIRKTDGSTGLGIAAKGATPREIGPIASNMGWIEPDILVSARAGALVGQRFDLKAERLVGEPFVVAERVDHFPTTSRALFSVSANRTIAFHNGTEQTQMTWFDRTGRMGATLSDVTGHLNARISPDGTRVLFDQRGPRTNSWDLWIADLARGIETRVTSDAGVEVTAVWLRDGRGIIYGSDRGGGSPQLFRRDLDTGVDTALAPGPRHRQALDVSPDGRMLGFVERGPAGNFELFTMPLDRPQDAARFRPPSRFQDYGPWFSPDNRVAAFSSNHSGRIEIYVAPLAAPNLAVTVSPSGGYSPRWSRDGKELYFLGLDRKLMSAAIRTAPSIIVGAAAPLFTLPAEHWIDYDPSPDGRFLALVVKQRADVQPIMATVNWRPPDAR